MLLHSRPENQGKVWLCLILFLVMIHSGAHASASYSYADLVGTLTNLEHLAELPPVGERSAEWTSRDRASTYDATLQQYLNWNANNDGTGNLGTQADGGIIVAQMNGPGCIWRIWSAQAGSGHVKIFLDGSNTAAVDLAFQDYFNRSHFPFNYPSITYSVCRGFDSYVPIPYNVSCKVVAYGAWGQYFHFNYSTFAPGVSVPTFSTNLTSAEQSALANVNDFFVNRLGSDPAGVRSGEISITNSYAIAPGTTVTNLNLSGPGAITTFKVRAQNIPGTNGSSWQAMRELTVSTYWDGEAAPSVWAPLGDFFGSGYGYIPYRALPLGMETNGWMYSHWYMPYASGARMVLGNDGSVTRNVEVIVTYAPLSKPIENLMRFHAKWNRGVYVTSNGRSPDYRFLNVSGQGRFVGLAMHVYQKSDVSPGPWWGEGDEKFFIDGETIPSWFGTGSEDYFGFAWGTPGYFSQPYHSQLLAPPGNLFAAGNRALNRFHIADNVPFQSGFDGCIEKWQYTNESVTTYGMMPYWYLAAGARRAYSAQPLNVRTNYYVPDDRRFAPTGMVAGAAQRADIAVEDFEGADYGSWMVTGNAFGSSPAHGTLPHQMTVDGFHGNGLVNSFNDGDGSTGKLTSPPFKIERKYLQFLIGGGGWDGKTCMNLLLDGKVVRTATGPNTQPGGSERLQAGQWDVGELEGKEVVLQIVDDATGGWGHINVDQIVESDRRSEAAMMQFDVARTIEVEKPYLNFPVKTGAPMRRVSVVANGETVRSFDIELADGQPDWWAFLDATPFMGKTIKVSVNQLPENSTGLSSVDQSEEVKSENLYHESLRPQFHFTSRCGWLNDPNGLVFYQGEYHLFYQHNPYGWNWGNMHWGHAVSKDLVHWKELPVALYPDEHGTMYSGSAVVDWNNTAGFQAGAEPPLVAMFTAAGNPFTQGIAYSNNRGRTWTKYKNNPVLGHIVAENRDPKVVWFAPQKKWVMALYLDHNDNALFSSRDLKSWQKLSDVNLPGDSECPNFVELSLDGDAQNTRWVFYGANGIYLVGKFDGQKFSPQTQPQRLQNGNCWYASQVYSDIPRSDGRCVLVPWGRLPDGEIFRGMPFNQMMGLPVELTLRSTGSGATLAVNPVRELKSLRGREHAVEPQTLVPGNSMTVSSGDLLEVDAEIAPGEAKVVAFDVQGTPIVYDAAAKKISCLGSHAALAPKNGNISLQIFVDRAAIDIFGGEGNLYMPMARVFSPEKKALKLSCQGGNARIVSLKVYELHSAW